MGTVDMNNHAITDPALGNPIAEAVVFECRTISRQACAPARAIMHENDHINGVLFIDRIRGKERQELQADLRQVKKKYSSS